MFNKPNVDRRVSFQHNIESAPVVEIPSVDGNAKRYSTIKEPFPLTGQFNEAYEGYQDEKKNEVADSTHEKEEKIPEKWEILKRARNGKWRDMIKKMLFCLELQMNTLHPTRH